MGTFEKERKETVRKEHVKESLLEAERFMKKCVLLQKRDSIEIKRGYENLVEFPTSKDVSAVKRASLDLSRMLSKLRGN